MGMIILAVGLGSAVCIYFNPSDADDATDSLTKRDVYQLEKLGGKELVLSAQLQEWFSSLWHGRRLALTVGCGSIAWSGGRFKDRQTISDLVSSASCASFELSPLL